MPSIQFTTSYKKNTGLMISPTEMKVLYFYGIDIKSTDGTKFSDDVFEMHIRQAQAEIEGYFDIKIFPELVTEKQQFDKDNYENNFPFIQTNYHVNKAYACIGLLNQVEQIVFPEEWLLTRSQNNGKEIGSRRISLVPTGTSGVSTSGEIILTGIVFQTGMLTFRNIPDYFTVQYLTGFKKIEWDIFNLVGMLASIPVLSLAGDLALPAGVASQSVGIDGLSQSISSTASATSNAYAARVGMYLKTMKETVDRLKIKYTGLRFTVV